MAMPRQHVVGRARGRPPEASPVASSRSARDYLRRHRGDGASAKLLGAWWWALALVKGGALSASLDSKAFTRVLKALRELRGALHAVDPDLLEWAALPPLEGKDRRGRLLRDLLSLVEAWVNQTNPPNDRRERIRAVLAAHGVAVFLAGSMMLDGVEPTASELMALEVLTDEADPTDDEEEKARRLDAWRKARTRAAKVLTRSGSAGRSRLIGALPSAWSRETCAEWAARISPGQKRR